MTTVTLRPNATIDAGSSTFTGGVTWQAVASDDSDASYATQVPYGASSRISLGTTTMSALAVTKSARVRMRVRSDSGVVDVWAYLYKSTGGTALATVTKTGQTTTITTITGAYTAVSLTQAEIDALEIRTNVGGASGLSGRWLELYVDLIYAAAPVCAVTLPTGTYTTNSRPPVTFTHTPGSGGGPQVASRIKIFNDDQYGLGGFDPETFTPYVDSGVVAGTAATWTPPSLVNDTYRAYVQTAQLVNGVNHWSAWDFEGFVVNVTGPVVSAVTASVEPSSGYAEFPPAATAINSLSVPDAAAFQALTQLDFRYAVAGVMAWATTDRYLVIHGSTTTSQVTWAAWLNSAGVPILGMSVTGSTLNSLPCDNPLTTGNELVLGRITWRNSDGRIQFFRKLGVARLGISAAMASNADWEQIGANETLFSGSTLSNTTQSLKVGSSGSTTGPFIGDYHGISVAPTIDAAAGLAIYPENFPTSESAGSFTAETGHTVTVNRAGSGPALELVAFDNASITVFVTRNTGGAAWEYVTVERSADGGLTWDFVRGASFTEADGDTFTVVDHEAPHSASVIYRAQATGIDGGTGNLITGAWVSSSVTSWTSGYSWLKSVTDPDLSRPVYFQQTPTLTRTRRSGAFQVLNRELPVVISDVLGGGEMNAVLLTQTSEEATALLALIGAAQPLLLQPKSSSHLDEMWVVVTQADISHTTSKLVSETKTWELTLVEADRPADSGPVVVGE